MIEREEENARGTAERVSGAGGAAADLADLTILERPVVVLHLLLGAHKLARRIYESARAEGRVVPARQGERACARWQCRGRAGVKPVARTRSATLDTESNIERSSMARWRLP